MNSLWLFPLNTKGNRKYFMVIEEWKGDTLYKKKKNLKWRSESHLSNHQMSVITIHFYITELGIMLKER